MTPLGVQLALLPLDPQVGKALLYGCLLGCLEPVLSICALLSHRNPFVLPLHAKDAADRAKRNFAGGRPSDHAALLGAFEQWSRAERAGRGAQFSWDHYLSGPTLKMCAQIREQFRTLLLDAGLLAKPPPGRADALGAPPPAPAAKRPKDDGAGSREGDENRHAGCWGVVKSCLAAGLCPNLIRVDSKGRRSKFLTAEHGHVKLHPGSVNLRARSHCRFVPPLINFTPD
jgi:HrpA-like RNA helicase